MKDNDSNKTSSSRRKFIKHFGLASMSLAIPFNSILNSKNIQMKSNNQFDVIIIGGSYSGLAAALALGRAMRDVLIIDSGKPCNRQTPHSHNFLTQDGKTPKEIATIAKQQLALYPTVKFLDGLALKGLKTRNGFEILHDSEEVFYARKIIFASGIKDIMPEIPGFSESWGISVLHCPYCHGYEVKGLETGILGNGMYGFEFSTLISNWTKRITLFTNGKSSLSDEQTRKLVRKGITIVEDEIQSLKHDNGYIHSVETKKGKSLPIKALYTKVPFTQNSFIPEMLGCQLTEEGYIKIDASQKTSIDGVFACGDNATRMRTVANSVSMGTTAGMMVNKELTTEDF